MHRHNGKRFIGSADEKPTAFLELESAILLNLHQRNRRCELFRPFGAQEFSLFSLSVVCRLPKPNPTSIAGRLTRWLQFFRRCRFKNSFPLRN